VLLVLVVFDALTDLQDFIHPGRSQRLGHKCDRATAFAVVAGVEHVIRDLR